MELKTRLERLLKQSDKLKQRIVKNLLQTMRKIEKERKERVADLDQAARIIAKELAELGHTVGQISVKRQGTRHKVVAKSNGKRVRRTPEQLKAEGEKVLALIRKAGKEGITGGAIRKAYPGAGQNIKTFVESNTGEKIRTTGAKASMKYHG